MRATSVALPSLLQQRFVGNFSAEPKVFSLLMAKDRFLPLKNAGNRGEQGGHARRPVRIRLRTPPSSLRKPHDSDTTLNRAFLRGFPATQFPDFGLCGRSRILVAVFGALSPHPKIPFPAVGLEREVRPRFAPVIRDRGRALQLPPSMSSLLAVGIRKYGLNAGAA
jgi:hypothetical protein